jgi:hypothetical protein
LPRRDRDYAAEYRRRQQLAQQKGYRSYGQQRYQKERSRRLGVGRFSGIQPSATVVDVPDATQIARWTFKITVQFLDDRGRMQYRSYIRRSNTSSDPSRFFGDILGKVQADYDVDTIVDIRVVIYRAV